AILAALVASGFETDTFTFLGFPPTKANTRNAWLKRLLVIGGTVIFFEAPHRLLETLSDLRRVAGDCEVAVGREMTKAHEEMVRGQISYIIQIFTVPRGEFTVVVRIPAHVAPATQPGDLVAEFGEMIENGALTRRKAIGVLARRHGIAPNEVYARLEAAKKLVK